MKRRRVVITGLGVIAPNGIGKDEFWTALVSGKSGIRKISSFHDPKPPCHVVGEVDDFDVWAHLNPQKPKAAKRMSRISQFAVASAKMALTDSAIDLTTIDPRRIGVCFGTTIGNPNFDQDHLLYLEQGILGLQATAWTELSPHAPTSHIANEFGITGPNFTCSVGCRTGLMAIEWGANQIVRNVADVMFVGSGDSLVSPLLITGLAAGGLLTREVDPEKASRPYDFRRDGLVPSEAAGVILLENLESAIARDARIYAEYLGCSHGVCSDGVDNTGMVDHNVNGEGLAMAITTALGNACLRPDQIDCINSHGLSHKIFDLVETNGFKLALGKIAYQIPITSIKSMTGASFSADGILQIISSCMILEQGVIPPTINLETPDPDCDLDYVPNKPRVARVKRILTNTRSVGGTHTVLILVRGND